MPPSTIPPVPDWPKDSRPSKELAANLEMHEKMRIKASIEYQKAVRGQVAKDILESKKSQEKQEEALAMPARFNEEATEEMVVKAKAPTTDTSAEDTKVLDTTDLQLFETMICSIALTRCNLIRAALKPFQELKVPDIEDLAKDSARDAADTFHNQIHSTLPSLQATIYNARTQDHSLLPMIDAGSTWGNPTIEKLQWITDIDSAIEESFHRYIDRLDKVFIDMHAIDHNMQRVDNEFDMACFVVEWGCKGLAAISSGIGSWDMVKNVIESISEVIFEADEETLKSMAKSRKRMKEAQGEESKKNAVPDSI